MQSLVTGTGTVRVPDVSWAEPSRVPWDHRFSVHVDELSGGMVKVASLGVIRGGTGADPNAGAERATTAPAIPPSAVSRSAVRFCRCEVEVLVTPEGNVNHLDRGGCTTTSDDVDPR